MGKKNRSNLDSPHAVSTPCDIDDIDGWFEQELAAVTTAAHIDLVRHVVGHLSDFVRWPTSALLLWEGSTRRRKYHSYPAAIKAQAKAIGFALDGRANGPASAALVLAGGERPQRFGSRNAWSSHHLYSGKYPYPGKGSTLHAAYDERHFTQSAGVVAIHPIADAMCDEYPAFSWLLRAHAFRRFGYDPDHAFVASGHDPFGFAPGHATTVLHTELPAP